MEPKKESKKSLFMIGVIIAGVALGLFGYLMWYVSPDEVTEKVKLIAVTESGCIVETMDGFPMNVGPCEGEPGQIIIATYDAKIKEREYLMNPTD